MPSMQIGVDLAKTVFEVAVSTAPGQVHERRRLSCTAFGAFFAALEDIAALEAKAEAIRGASARGATSPPISASPRGSTPRGRCDDWGRSASTATPTSACS